MARSRAGAVRGLLVGRRGVRVLHDLEAIGRLARLSTSLPDVRAEVCAVARQALAADTVVCFEAVGTELESLEVAGVPLPRNMIVEVDDPDSTVAGVFRDGSPAFERRGDGPVPADFPQTATVLAVPILRGVDRYGVLVWLWASDRRPLSRYESILVQSLVADKGLAVERRHLLHTSDASPRHWGRPDPARRMHDALVQTLAPLQAVIDAASAAAEGGQEVPPAVLHRIADEVAVVRERIREVTSASLEDRPLIELGLADALAAIVADARGSFEGADVAVALTPARPSRLDLRPSVLETAYFVVREALANAAEHAGAQHVRVDVAAEPGRLTATVEDDGRGFDVRAPLGGRFGLGAMRERAAVVGGELILRSAPGAGATVSLTVPHPGSADVLSGPGWPLPSRRGAGRRRRRRARWWS